MIPITLVVGFLGAGKTTLMRRLIDAHRQERIVYLVNEFSATDVDANLLRQGEDKVLAVAGGSIFCKCKVGEFIQHLGRIAGLQTTQPRSWDGIIIEASGMANPKSIHLMLRETKLDQIYELKQVICIVEPSSFKKLITMLPAIRDQIEVADRVLINKTDLYPAEEVQEVDHMIRSINPIALIEHSIRCDVNLQLDIARDTQLDLEQPYEDACPDLLTIDIVPDSPFDLARAKQLAEEFADSIYRIKGFVQTEDETLEVQATISTWNTTPAKKSEAPRLVLIGPTAQQDRLQAYAKQIGKTNN